MELHNIRMRHIDPDTGSVNLDEVILTSSDPRWAKIALTLISDHYFQNESDPNVEFLTTKTKKKEKNANMDSD
jgi:hypothetical protein